MCLCEVVVWFRLFHLFYCGSASSFIFIISSLRSNYRGTVNISHNYREVIRYGAVDFLIFVNWFSFQYRHWNVNWFLYLALNLMHHFVATIWFCDFSVLQSSSNVVKSVGVGGPKYTLNIIFLTVFIVQPEDFTILLYAGLFLFGWKVFCTPSPSLCPVSI